MKNWCKGKTNEQIEDELYRIVSTWEHKDLVNQVCYMLSKMEKKEWINQWHNVE